MVKGEGSEAARVMEPSSMEEPFVKGSSMGSSLKGVPSDVGISMADAARVGASLVGVAIAVDNVQRAQRKA